MAHETQYAILMYNLGITYSAIHQRSAAHSTGGKEGIRTRVDASLADISDSSTLDHVPHGESLDGLILAHAARAVRAAHVGDVATSLLVAAAISSFLGLAEEGRSAAVCWVGIHTTSKGQIAHPSQICDQHP